LFRNLGNELCNLEILLCDLENERCNLENLLCDLGNELCNLEILLCKSVYSQYYVNKFFKDKV